MGGTKIFFASTLVLLLFPLNSFAQNSFSNEMQKLNSGKKQKILIEQFAQQAKARDTASIMAEMDPSIIKSAGEVNIVQMLEKTVFPFFAPYIKLSNYDQMTNATLPDGRAGLWHYTYIASSEQNMLPFRIAVIDTADGPKILDIVVNECVKGRHPICK